MQGSVPQPTQQPAPGALPRPAFGGAALLIVDMINAMDFAGAETLRGAATAAAARILHLREQADAIGVPVVYVNDNHDRWHSERSRIVEHCMRLENPGREISALLAPQDGDYFVIKPEFSGFYATNLPVLLPRLEVGRVVLTGVAADICVLFTAADAHMRDYELWVPSDAVASQRSERSAWALDIMRESMGAQTSSTNDLTLKAWIEEDHGSN